MFAQVSGTVFRDYNSNGAKDDQHELGVKGISVSATDAGGTIYGPVITADDGTYTISGVPTGKEVRIEFSIPATVGCYNEKVFESFGNSSNSTSVQFVKGGATNVSYGVNNPIDYAKNSPDIATTCFINGDRTLPKTAIQFGIQVGVSDMDVALKFNYSKAIAIPSGAGSRNNGAAPVTPNNTYYSIAEKMGSVWGLAYQKDSKKLFMSAIMRRHSQFGPLGTGGIYVVNNADGNTFNVTDNRNFIDVQTIGIITGTDPHPLPATSTNNTAFDLAVCDAVSFDKVGKIGIGDIDLSDDGIFLYMTNLNDRKLYRIKLNNPATTPTSADVLPYDTAPWLASGTCQNGVARPWATKYYRDKVYVGVVCTGENGGTVADLKAMVYELDAKTDVWKNTPTFTQALNYTKGKAASAATVSIVSNQGITWNPWTNIFPDPGDTKTTFTAIYPSPILSDIEFDTDGSIILGLMDRFGHQAGSGTKIPKSDGSCIADPARGFGPYTSVSSGGDLLRIGMTAGCVYESENNGKAVNRTSLGVGNGQGIGGGEFYSGDNIAGVENNHEETFVGGLALLPGSNQVLGATYDPMGFVSGGINFFDNTTGKAPNRYEVYPPANAPFPGKGNGVGDIELLLTNAPIQIGNRVWYDKDKDGIQDAEEKPLPNIKVALYNSSGVKVSEVTTNALGEYYFDTLNIAGGKLLPLSRYEIRVAKTTINDSLSLTESNTGTNDAIDSDAETVGADYVIPVLTGNYGENNHTYDIGFAPELPDLKVTKTVDKSIVKKGQNAKYTVTIKNQGKGKATKVKLEDLIPAGTTLVSATPSSTTSTDKGTFSAGIWSLDSLVAKDSVVLVIEVTATTEGVKSNVAQIKSMNEKDVDSTPGNSDYKEDDIATACFTVPYEYCKADKPSFTITAPDSLTTVKWFKNGTELTAEAGKKFITVSDSGSYYYEGITPNTLCKAGSCCPVILDPYKIAKAGKDTTICSTITTFKLANAPAGTAWSVASGNPSAATIDATTGQVAGLTKVGAYQFIIKGDTCCADTVKITLKSCDVYGSIGDYVWTDINRDGQQGDPLVEKPIEGVKVYLYDGTGITKLDSTTTDANGKYTFDSLVTGAYKVKFVLPTTATSFTKANSGDDKKDSDVGTNGFSQVININTTLAVTDTLRNNPQIDAGIICQPKITATPNQLICKAGTPSAFTMNKVLGNVTSQQWYGPLNDTTSALGTAIAGASNPNYTPVSPASGTKYYAVVAINDEAACSDTAFVVITIAPPVKLQVAPTNPTCYAGTGTLTATASAGKSPYTYSWSTGATTSSISAVAAGSYTITVTDANGCKVDSTLLITQPDSIGLSVTSTNVTCNTGTDGVLMSMVTGGKPAFAYQWFTGTTSTGLAFSTNPTVTGLTAGTFTLKVTDANGCFKNRTFTLTEPVAINIAQTATNNICFDQSKGTITVNAQGGVAPYTITWKVDGVLNPALNGLTTLSNLKAGVYELTLVDANGCTVKETTTVTQPTKMVINYTKKDGVCSNGNKGSAVATVTGGVAPYTYAWSNGIETASVTDLATGNYKLVVTDSKACKDSVTVFIDAQDCRVDVELKKTVAGTCERKAGDVVVFKVVVSRKDTVTQNAAVVVKDVLATQFTFVSATPSKGTFDDGTGLWSGITLAKTDSATLTVTAKINAGSEGLLCNQAYVNFIDKDDIDSQAGNTNPVEDDIAYACVSVPIKLCSQDSPNGVALTTPAELTNIKWFKDGVEITAEAGKATINVSAAGSYTYTGTSNGTECQVGNCCPVIIQNTCFGSIGDYVWTDTNNDGQQAGESPIAGVKVYLYNAAGTTKLDSTVTDATGKYLFDSLVTGSYKVKFVAPAGTIPAKSNTGADVSDSDAGKNGFTHTINIDTTKPASDTLRNNPQIDAGFVPVGSIGDYVWNDKNGNGIQNGTEPPIDGVKVYLLDGVTGAKLDSTTTAGGGKYLFDSLVAGSYKVRFVIPAGSEATLKTQGGDPTKDSNINPDGTTDAVVIDTTKPVGDPARDNRDVDAGIKPAYGSIGDYVWTDKNNDGQQAGESPIAGVKVYLYNAAGTTKLDSTVTDANGKYLFDSLVTGSYKVKFVAPAGTVPAKANIGDDKSDSDAGKNGFTQVINIDTSKLPADTLRNNPQIDAGFVPVGSIGDYVWNDKNGDGKQDASEAPIDGIKVYLLNSAGVKIDSTVTAGGGKYLFDSLVAGDYSVRFVIPVGSEATLKAATGNVANDSNINPDGTTDKVTIDTTQPLGDPARDNRDVDAGIKPAYGSIGDYVWTDKNNDGQQAGETPIQGVKVYLYDGTGTTKLDSTVTDVNGKYLFDSLLTGSYKVKFVAPAGTIPAKQNIGADVSDSDAGKNGFTQVINIDTSKLPSDTLRNNPQIDAGFVPVGSIGDYVFFDKDNNNVQSAGDTPIAGVKVYLLNSAGVKIDSTVTNSAGKYLFDSLLAGDYKVQFVKPVGTLIVTKGTGTATDSDADQTTGLTDKITIDTSLPLGDIGRDNPTIDAGLKGEPQYGSIGDYVWTDKNNDGQQAGETPIQGVKVYLYDGTGTTKLDSTTTDVNGKYLFDSLVTGSYKVKFVAPTGMIPAKQNVGDDKTDSDANKLGFSQVVNIDISKLPADTLRNNPQIDAGFVPVGSIGDYVWNDKNGDGKQDAGEAPIDGIKVYLLNSAGVKIDSTVTANGGKYLFDSLVAGDYSVRFVIPVGSEATLKAATGNVTNDSNINPDGTTDKVTIDTTQPLGDPARDNRDVDAGIKPAYGSIGDYVWTDKNNDGQQTAGELPIAGVKVYLYNAAGTTKLDSTVTDVNGKYLFDSLLTGSYKVKFVAPAGTIPAKQNIGTDVSDSDANKLGFSQLINIDTTKPVADTLRNNPQIDAGFVPVGSIGDYVFLDKDNSNTQTAGDTPVAGVKVYLLNNAGVKIDSTVTDVAGKYLFDSLVAGTYTVQFVKPAGLDLVTKDTGADDKDSDANPADGKSSPVTLDTTQPVGSPARDNRDVDAGLKGIPQYGSIGDYVWTDKNNDGQQAGETPIQGVKVILYDGTGTTKLDSTVTDVNGKYLFDSLLTGSYKVKFVAPAGTIPAKQNIGADVSDSDANKLGFSQLINIDTTKPVADTLRNNPQIDAGFVPVGSIGDYVFLDKDNSNTQTAGDTPVGGVKVYLLNNAGAKIDSTVTDANGKYLFDSLVAGTYTVQFVKPAGLDLVTKDTGTDDKDSDANPVDGKSSPVTLDTTQPLGSPARDNRDVDAGLKGIPQYGSIGDYVWTDKNNDGQQAGDTPIQGVKVILYDGTGTTKLDSTVTDANGKYLFDSLLTGSYKVKFVAPAGTIPAKQNIGADVSDSDANKLGFSQLINIDTTKPVADTLRNNPQIDAGFVPVGSIGDYVLLDKDNSNTQTAGDTPVGGVKVYLLNNAGAKIDSTVTDANGKYLFDSLVAGTYTVQFVKPAGLDLVTKDTGADDKDSDANPVDGKSSPVTLDTTQPLGSPARDNRDVDAGLKGIPQYGSIGDYVWTDKNNDGQQAGDAPIQGVKVILYDGTGTTKLDSTTTDVNGKYLFDSLLTGSYKVKFVAPAGTIPAKSNVGADVSDSDAGKNGFTHVVNIDTTKPVADTLRNNPQIDAGFVPVGSIGDYVFNDKDNNNVQSVGDTPVAGVKVYLLNSAGVKIDSTVTNSAGKYLFDSLLAGDYKVQFVKPVGTLIVTKGTGTATDSDADQTTGITDKITIDTSLPLGDIGRDNSTIDAGLKGEPQYGSIGDYVWFDTNKDGLQSSGEPAVKGITVQLTDALGNVLATTATDNNGKYLFSNLVSGNYRVKFIAPKDSNLTVKGLNPSSAIDSNPDVNTGLTDIVNIDTTKPAGDPGRDNRDVDAGITVNLGSIAGKSFDDNDKSNTQNAGDTDRSGVKVYLYKEVGGVYVKVDSVITDSQGNYKFNNLTTGNYQVEFKKPNGTTFSNPNVGDDTKDSDASPVNGRTGIIPINTNLPETDLGRNSKYNDAGFTPIPVECKQDVCVPYEIKKVKK